MRDPESFHLDDDDDDPEDLAYAIDLARADLDDERDGLAFFEARQGLMSCRVRGASWFALK
jgi:hypothetical protein